MNRLIENPQDIPGIPTQFRSWRPFQSIAVNGILETEKRFLLQNQPTGSGKSLTYMSASMVERKRTVVLTATKGLQDQIANEFMEMHIGDVRGRNSYTCRLEPRLTCDAGACHAGFECDYKDNGCYYYDAVRNARKSFRVTTNYMYWMVANRYGEGLGKVDLLILDEAHDAFEFLIGFLAIRVEREKAKKVLRMDVPRLGTSIESWKRWALETKFRLEDQSEEVKRKLKSGGASLVPGTWEKVKAMRTYAELTKRILEIKGDWKVVDDKDEVKFDPIDPDRRTIEECLFRHASKVVLTSATLTEKVAELLKIRPEEYEYQKFPSSFPVDRRPVFHIRGARVNKRMTERQFKETIIRNMDSIIDDRRDRKGIIHTHSYERRDWVVNYSRHNDVMFTNRRRNLNKVVEEFKRTWAPAILVSPSVVAGYDFPRDECEFQIVLKIPFPNIADPILRERSKRDKELLDYMAMQTLVQSCGRGMRSETDWCETFILDDTILWWLDRAAKFAPQWFLDSLELKRVVVPKPIERGQI